MIVRVLIGHEPPHAWSSQRAAVQHALERRERRLATPLRVFSVREAVDGAPPPEWTLPDSPQILPWKRIRQDWQVDEFDERTRPI
jgi:hypothetical protein